MKSMNLIRVFTLAVISFFTVSALKAQDVQMVILQHGDSASAFYGTSAFVDAMKAAVKGDAITLSAGTFTSATIDKAVTIQGAGYVTDVAKGRNKTILSGDFDVSLLQDADEVLKIDGIYAAVAMNIKTAITGLSISKSSISNINILSNNNCIIDKCRINRFVPSQLTTNLTIKNSIICQLCGSSYSDNSLIENCIFNPLPSEFSTCLKGAVIRNSIIACGSSLYPTCSSYNNCFIEGNCNQSVNQANNYSDTSTNVFGSDVFSSNMDFNSWNINFTLTESAAAKYLGTDGKQVGIYGGDSPFTDVPSTPQITVKSIDSKVSNGKLNATIHVEAQN
jgi:hypothetical protein